MRPWAWRTQLSIFFAAYVLYDAARWIFASDPDRARVHAEWIIDLERSVHVAARRPAPLADLAVPPLASDLPRAA